MGLPCRHIFAVREYLSLPCADPHLCLERWTQKYYIKNQRIFKNVESQINEESSVNVSSIKNNGAKKKSLSQGQKLKIGKTELLEINPFLSELSTPKFYAMIGVLAEIKRRLALNIPVDLTPVIGKESKQKSSTEEVLIEDEGENVTTEDEINEYVDDDFTANNIYSGDFFSEEASDILPAEENLLSNSFTLTAEDLLSSEEVIASKMQLVFDGNCKIIDKNALDQVENKNEQNNMDIIQNIQMPLKQKMRGRPKKSLTTTPMGLPKTKAKTERKERTIPFIKKSLDFKIKKILNFFVDEEKVEKALKGHKIEESAIEVKPELITQVIVDDDVNLAVIKSYLTEEAWLAVEQLSAIKKDSNQWKCYTCQKDLKCHA